MRSRMAVFLFFIAAYVAYSLLTVSSGGGPTVAAQEPPEPVRSVSRVSQAPQLRQPGQRIFAAGSVTYGGPIRLQWVNPPGATQYQIEVMPAPNSYTGQPDGPGVNLIRNLESEYTIQSPVMGQGNYILLPSMTYTWRVRASDATASIGENDPSWGPWAEGRLRTLRAMSGTIRGQEPCNGCVSTSLTPTLMWANDDPSIFYYEVQLSKDPLFNLDPQTAKASVYYNLVHAGATHPLSSWTVPESYALQPGSRFYWRVRPRVQGDGVPVDWPSSSFFETPTLCPPPLQCSPPAADLAVSDVTLSATTVQPGQSVTVEYTIRNLGPDQAPPTRSGVFLSVDATISPSDTALEAMEATDTVPGLAVGASLVRTLWTTIPTGIVPGTYYLGVYGDSSNAVLEANEDNNGDGRSVSVVAWLPAPTPSPTRTPSPAPTSTATPTSAGAVQNGDFSQDFSFWQIDPPDQANPLFATYDFGSGDKLAGLALRGSASGRIIQTITLPSSGCWNLTIEVGKLYLVSVAVRIELSANSSPAIVLDEFDPLWISPIFSYPRRYSLNPYLGKTWALRLQAASLGSPEDALAWFDDVDVVRC